MQITVRYFAALREALGPVETVELPEPMSLAALRGRLIERSAAHAQALRPGRTLRCAVNQRLVAEPAVTLIEAGAEVAFFPPVTGG